MKASEWAFDRMKEAFDLVAKDDGRKDEQCARDHAQKHGLLGAHHRARWRTRRSHNVPQEDTFGGSLPEKPQSGGAQYVEKSTTGGNG